ncbi:MAG: DUF4202 domain-containing protein [Spirochaetota bacterium]
MENIYQLIDDANQKDPRLVPAGQESVAKELLYGQRMTEILLEFAPEATEVVQIACRGQHIERWTIPRSEFPMTKAGYLKWRTTLNQFHQKRIAEILQQVQYPAESIEQVQQCMNKKNLASNPNTQTLEDVACLVFLKYEFEDFIKKHEDEKIVKILQKTWKKMSEKAHSFASSLSFSERGQELLKQALGL